MFTPLKFDSKHRNKSFKSCSLFRISIYHNTIFLIPLLQELVHNLHHIIIIIHESRENKLFLTFLLRKSQLEKNIKIQVQWKRFLVTITSTTEKRRGTFGNLKKLSQILNNEVVSNSCLENARRCIWISFEICLKCKNKFLILPVLWNSATEDKFRAKPSTTSKFF